nr:hypothetical protein [Tanacetum cinerariifolium]
NPPLLKGSCTQLFIIYINLKDRGKTVAAVNLFKLDVNNMTWEELGDLKHTILSVELATDSSVFYSSSSELAGGYIHILADKGKSIYSYHVKDKTIFLSSIPCVAGTNPGLGGERVHVHCKQEKEEGHKEDQIVIRSVKSNREIKSHRGLKKKEFCVGVNASSCCPFHMNASSFLIISAYEFYLDVISFNAFSDEVVFRINVLAFSVKDWILHQCYG